MVDAKYDSPRANDEFKVLCAGNTMSNPNPDERSAPDALGLMVGWFCIFGSVATPIFGTLKEWKIALALIAIGTAFIVPILRRERRARAAQRPVEPSNFMVGWPWIVIGVFFLAANPKEWKTPAMMIFVGAVMTLGLFWRERRKRP